MELKITLKDLPQYAHDFWNRVSGRVFAFHGEMGAGKTTLIAALCAAKGVKGHISSPTFSLINEYHYKEEGMLKRIFHIDLYRLKDEQEAINAGIEDCIYAEDICFIEWPERIPTILPDETVDIYLIPADADTRLMKIERHR